MHDDAALDAFMAAAPALGLVIAPEWRAGVRAQLRATLALAALVTAVPPDDSAEPAPVFVA